MVRKLKGDNSEATNNVRTSNNEKKRKRKSNKGSFAYVAVPVAAATEARDISNTDERALRKRQKNVDYNVD